MSVEWQAVRAEFPSLNGRTYLNTASFGQLPRRAWDAAAAHFAQREKSAAIDFLDWFEELQPLRALIARLIHAHADDIAFVPNAAYALALAMSAVKWQPGDELLTLRGEFPNQLYAHAVAGVQGVECDWPDLLAHVSERTRLVALSTVNYTTGLRPDLSTVLDGLRQRGIIVYLDGTQSAGALDFRCSVVQPDFFAVDAYKWMISPNGAAFLYVHPEVRARLQPNVLGWRSDKDWRNVGSLQHGSPRFGGTAEKYEPGMLPFACLYAMQASLELLDELGIGVIEERVLGLAGLIREELRAMGAEFHNVAGSTLPSQIVTARLPKAGSAALAETLEGQGISISARRVYLRISPHFYNNEQDVERLIDALRASILLK